MGCKIFHLTNTDNAPDCYAIEQGATFDSVIFLHPDNLVGWTPEGEVRKNYVSKEPVGTLPLAVFVFEPIVYQSVTLKDGTIANRSIIQPLIGDDQTILMPIPKARGSSKPLPGFNCWVYDVKLIAPSVNPAIGRRQVIRLARGFVEVDGDV